jgi:hypothetical protein
MPSFFNRPRPEFVAAYPEPSRAELSAGHQIDRDVVLAALDRLALWARRRGNADLVDLILDERAAIRPPRPLAVPGVPGRPS